MACETKTYTNILDLPQVTNIGIGDFFIIEQPEGTNIIDYADVLWTLDNMTFASTISSQETKIKELETQFKGLLETQVKRLTAATNSSFNISNNNQTSIVLKLSDAYTYNRLTNKSSTIITIPKSNWQIGTEITFRRTTNAGDISLVLEEGVKVNDEAIDTISPGGSFMIKFIGNNTWDFI